MYAGLYLKKSYISSNIPAVELYVKEFCWVTAKTEVFRELLTNTRAANKESFLTVHPPFTFLIFFFGLKPRLLKKAGFFPLSGIIRNDV
jgi:hypothetical protein